MKPLQVVEFSSPSFLPTTVPPPTRENCFLEDTLKENVYFVTQKTLKRSFRKSGQS